MCGIIFACNLKTKSVRNWILNQYEDQHSRGSQGFSIVRIDENNKIQIDRATEPVKFMLDLYRSDAQTMLVHHRHPTSTANKIKQTHPILVRNGSLKFEYLVVHNGVIQNDEALWEEHDKLGFVYTTLEKEKAKYSYGGSQAVERFEVNWNDSEGLAIEVARFIEGQTNQIGAEGPAAFIALQIDKETQKLVRVFFGRNDANPLNMAKTRGEICLSSEGKGSAITPFVLYSFIPEGEMKLERRAITWKKTEYKPYATSSTATQPTIGFGEKKPLTSSYTPKRQEAPQFAPKKEAEDAFDAQLEEEQEIGIAECYQDTVGQVEDLISTYLDDCCADPYITPNIDDTMRMIRHALEEGVQELKSGLQKFEKGIEAYAGRNPELD